MATTPAAPYFRRIVDDALDELVAGLPATAVEGAKGVGKTATALQRATTTYELDDDRQRTLIEADPSQILGSPPPVLIDEWQRVPDTWDQVRRAVDAGAEPGRFLLTGSASPRGLGTHSGAGRIVSLKMRPLSLPERLNQLSEGISLSGLLTGARPAIEGETEMGLGNYAEEILRSGFPGIRQLSGRLLRAQLNGYLERIVDRDFEQLGHSLRNPAGLRRWMTAYAAATATAASYEKIRDAATAGFSDKPARSTTIPYRDVLERLWVLEPLDAWIPTRNRIAQLSAPQKHHLVDPALAARLLEVDEGDLLKGREPDPRFPHDGVLFGALFESLVTQSVRVLAQACEARVGHLRTQGGRHEVDLIIERELDRVVAFEVKLSGTVDDHDVRHLHWLRNQLGENLLDAAVITAGPHAFRRRDGIAVIPAALLIA